MSSRTSGRSWTRRSQLAYAGVAAAGRRRASRKATGPVCFCARPKSSTRTRPFGIDHHVIRLEIEMQDAAIVRIGDRVAQLAQYANRRLERELVRLQAPYQRSERLAIEQFHGDEIDVALRGRSRKRSRFPDERATAPGGTRGATHARHPAVAQCSSRRTLRATYWCSRGRPALLRSSAR